MKKRIYTILTLALAIAVCAGFVCAMPTAASAANSSLAEASEMFTSRDLEQTADLSGATYLEVSDGENITITAEGVYVVSGTASEATIVVDAEDAKVQLVLNGVTITNSDFPCIYVRAADKVFVTTAADSSLSVTGAFTGDGETNTDGAIYSKSDLVLNGTATLTISSTANGVVSKDDLKITGGSYVVNAGSHALEGKDSIRICGGSFRLTAGKDGLHSDNAEEADKGFIYLSGGSFSIQASDDGVHAVSFIQIDGGTFTITASEGIESTMVVINDGSITISASDDGVNAARKSAYYQTSVEINGGELNITMGAGDTDGVDSNGTLSITGGTISVSGNSCFDVDGTVSFTGGTVYVNGQQVSSIPVQMMGGGMGGQRGGWGGMNGGQMGGNMPGGGMGGQPGGMGGGMPGRG